MANFIDIIARLIDEVTEPATKIGKAIHDMAFRTMKLDKETGKMTKTYKTFRTELLGVMFGGMQLQRTMMGLLQPAMEAYGIFDLWGTTLMMVFIPIMDVLAPALYWLMEILMDMPDSVKLFIGILVVAGAIMGGLAAIIGSVLLAVSSFMIALVAMPILAPILIAAFGGIIGVLTALVATQGDTGKKIKEGIENIGSWISEKFKWFIDNLPAPLKGIIEVFKPILEILKAMFTGDFETIKTKTSEIITLMVDWIKEKILGGFRDLFSRLKELPVIGDVISLFEKIWNAIIGFLKEASQIKTIEDAFAFVIKSIKKWAEWGYEIASKMMEGIAKNFIPLFKTFLSNLPVIGELFKTYFKGPEVPIAPYYQKGGFVPETGLAMLHRGETVIPAGKGISSMTNITFSPNVSINATLSSPMDIREIGKQLLDSWHLDLRRLQM